MGRSVHYRGRLVDPERIETLEDRLVDLALDLGGKARIWRSRSDADPPRWVRGAMLELAPGIESVPLLFSPEGWLIDQTRIEEAEAGQLHEPPWISVKTEFGPIEGHVVLVELLRALADQGYVELELQDEGEQPEIDELARRVRQTLRRPPEHPPVVFEEGVPETEQDWDAAHREQVRRQERMTRIIEEALGSGLDRRQAFEHALEAEGLEPPQPGDLEEFDEPEEPWRESLPEAVREEPESLRVRHPLAERARALVLRVFKLPAAESPPLEGLSSGLLDLCGGLVQALGSSLFAGHQLVQLKRALRGAAFARGGLIAAAASGLIESALRDELLDELEAIEGEAIEALRAARRRLAEGD